MFPNETETSNFTVPSTAFETFLQKNKHFRVKVKNYNDYNSLGKI